ncbi:DUF5011 domain-containing protein [Listeria sp. FSL L7-0478]|uniref:LPXTG cell wall anchor domain-containing protein n=1 Tax=Listeria cossartiae TaxID=2838249 RepID=UPI0016286B01|nr:immunoglobulin-like domain-containing protein [Listeria cossartiae]MBC1985816.1 DUF5011 domain-containing protein [Listeria cossartiae subsp. cossartiae]
MKKIIAIITTVALLAMVVFNFTPGIVAKAANSSESNLTYKDVRGGFYFVGYENVQLEKGKTYKYKVAYEANVDMTITDTITGQSAKAGLFVPNSSGAALNNNAVTRTQDNVMDVANDDSKVFTHTFEFTANEDTKADIGVFAGAGSVLPTTPEASLIWKNITVTDETPAEAPTAPVINAEDKTIKQNETFNPLNDVTATDKKDGDITSAIQVTKNTVDTTKIGEYDVDYKVTNSSEITTLKSIKVTVTKEAETANTAPVINAKDQTIKVGDLFNSLKGVTATDKEDGDLTAKIKVTKDTVNNTKKGVYQVTYTVTDSGNLSATLTIKVTVTQDLTLIIEPIKLIQSGTPSDPTKPKQAAGNAETPNVKASKIPKTGDNSMIWVVLAGLGLATVGITTYRKKANR